MMNEMRRLREDVRDEEHGDEEPADHQRAQDNMEVSARRVVNHRHRG
jgi:hypothetical protein